MISPKEQFIRAKNALASGKNDTARTLFRQLLETHPNSAETHFHLGRLELQMGKAKRAKKHLLSALKINAKEPAIWLSLMDAEIALKDRKAISKLMISAKKANLAPAIRTQLKNKAVTGNRQGVAKLVGVTAQEFESARAAYMQGDFEVAEKRAASLIKKAPKSAPLHAIRAASYAQMRELTLARDAFEKAIQIDPNYFEARLQLGQLLLGTGQMEEAGVHLTKAHEMASDSPFVHLSLGILYSTLHNDVKAIEHLENARNSITDEPRLFLFLAQSYQAVARPQDAEAALEKAQKHVLAMDEQIVLIRTLTELGHVDQANETLDALSAQNPDSIEVLPLKVSLYMQSGNFDGMREAVRTLVSLGVTDGSQLLTYARSAKMSTDDPITRAMEKAIANEDESEETRSALAFALAKAYDDWGEYPKSFNRLQQANNAQRGDAKSVPSTGQEPFPMARRLFEGSVKVLDAPQAETPFPRHIQITGMPRSGTTLVEQIVSSHSTVTAAGELGIVGKELNTVLEPIDIEGRAVTAMDLAAFETAVTGAYHRLFPDAEVVTDKAIMSSANAGLVARAMPSSRMVVLMRDPRDNCLSIYKNRFQTGSHPYSTDLEELARQYLYFLDIQAYWRENAPGSLYEIRYEDLVKDTDNEIRKLIDYCGLEWEDACLDFHLNTRRVKTLSAFQVRQKIYSSSAGAWKNYEEELQPLIKILDKGGALDGY